MEGHHLTAKEWYHSALSVLLISSSPFSCIVRIIEFITMACKIRMEDYQGSTGDAIDDRRI